MTQLFINGIDRTSDVTDGLTDLEIEIGLNTETKTIGKVLSSDITVTGDTFKYLNSIFFKNCDAWTKSENAIIKTDICKGISLDCEITSEGMEKNLYDEEMSFNVKSTDNASIAYARLDSELITSNGFAETNDIPIHYYVDQPNYLMWILIILTMPIRATFNAIDRVLTTICNIATIGLNRDKCDINISGAIFSAFDTWILGTGRWAPAPLVREMITYQCNAVGLKFVSSILNDPSSTRYNLALFCLTGGENGDFKNTSKAERIRLLFENDPLYTTIGLLNDLSTVFGADYRIIGDTLYFEPINYFDELRTRKLFNIKDVCTTEPLKLGFNTSDACAYGEYTYTNDSTDVDGNSTLHTHYFGRSEFNDPFNPAQKGKCIRQLNFASAKFMFDKKSYHKNGFFNFQRFLDEFRDGPDTFISEFLFSNEGVIRKFDLVISSPLLTLNKLLVLENGFNRNDAQTIKEKYKVWDGKQYWIYNKPMHIDQLIKDFYWVDNPRIRKNIYKLNDFEIDCSCDYILDLIDHFQTIYIETDQGKAIPKNITVSFTENNVVLKFTDIVINCR